MGRFAGFVKAVAERLRLRWLAAVIATVLLTALVPWAWSRLSRQQLVLLQVDQVDAAPAPSESGSLRIASYNIAHGRGLSEINYTDESPDERIARLDEIARVLCADNPDVVVLNEVDFDSHWSFGVDQAQHIARRCGLTHVVEVPNYDARVAWYNFRFGNALLSRHPLRDPQVIELPAYSALESFVAGKKRAFVATAELPSGPVRVIAVHLSYRSESVRAASARVLAEVAKHAGPPVIIAGDTNSAPPGFANAQSDDKGDNAMTTLDSTELFRRHPETAGSAENLTFPSQRPDQLLDWILIPRSWRFEKYAVQCSDASDHCLVRAEVVP